MNFLRFSIRRLLILTGLVAVLLYLLILRPITVAKQFTHEIETSTDLEAVSRKYFNEMDSEGAKLEGRLDERTWADVFKCRQNFTIAMVRPMPNDKHQLLVWQHDYFATPLGIQQRDDAYLETRETR